MNEINDERAKCIEDLISAIFRQAVTDEVYYLTHGEYEEGYSVVEFVESGEFATYAALLISLDEKELLKKFWENITLQAVKKLNLEKEYFNEEKIALVRQLITNDDELKTFEKAVKKYV